MRSRRVAGVSNTNTVTVGAPDPHKLCLGYPVD